MAGRKLATLLRLDDTAGIAHACTTLRTAHLAFIVSRLQGLLAAVSERMASSVRRSLDALKPEALLRILAAPQTCLELCAGSESSAIAFLRRAVAAECHGYRQSRIAHGPIWTSMGDVCIENGARITSQRIVHERFVIDLCSPFANRTLIQSNFRPPFGSATPFSPIEEGLVLQQIEEALDGILASGTAAYVLVSSMLKTIMPRKDLLNQTFKGSSNRAMIGRANLFNAHRAAVTDIASSLVHESVHTLLYLEEQQAPLVFDEDNAQAVMVVSPWSRKSVHLLALLHATHVWYALSYFFGDDAYRLFPQSEVDYYREFCARGFRDSQILSVLNTHRHLIRPEVISDIEKMATLAQGEAGAWIT